MLAQVVVASAGMVRCLMEATMQTDTSTRESHSLIASDRVEGTPVRRSSGEKIGTIERLMIDKLSGNVAYAVLSFGGFSAWDKSIFPSRGHGSPTTARSAPTSSISVRRS